MIRLLASLVVVTLLALCFVPVLQAADAGKPAERHAGVGAGEGKTGSIAERVDVQEELGRILPYWTVLPFMAILLGIALIPLLNAHFWESNLNKSVITTVCSIPVLAYFLWMGPLGMEVIADVLHDYYAFIILLVALFTISGGIHLEGNLQATPIMNTVFLAIGSLLASFIGTTGASMLLIRPLLNTNRERKNKKHIFIFFIFLVSNIGGSLLPVGDPPLFLGYLFGVPFFWTLRLWPLWLTEVALLLIVFYLWDTRAYSRESRSDLRRDASAERKMKVHGLVNIVLILGVLLSVIVLNDYHAGEYTIRLAWARQPIMVLLALISFVLDHRKRERAHRHGHVQFKSPREHNAFTFYAMIEVAVLFIGIFITMTPAICLLKAHGAETGVKHAWQFFWMSGGLSSFLDNAPTYATYFALGQGVTKGLLSGQSGLSVVLANTGPITEQILMAISAGSVFMGANSYIGNAPNFMVKSLCEEAKVAMPSFFGYMVYSCGILIPSFLLITFLFFI
ncbi:MAG TPA: sodium:proton antiporter [Thermodesulfobacteriota bacterium]|nr:sodium:proton antiporter [Thermodesulfobacteriota bacterium]